MSIDLSFLDHPSFGSSYAFDADDAAAPLSPEAASSVTSWDKYMRPSPPPPGGVAAAPAASLGLHARSEAPPPPRSPPSPERASGLGDALDDGPSLDASAASADAASAAFDALARYEESLLASAAAVSAALPARPPLLPRPRHRTRCGRLSAAPRLQEAAGGRSHCRHRLNQRAQATHAVQAAPDGGAPPCASPAAPPAAAAAMGGEAASARAGGARAAAAPPPLPPPQSLPMGASMVDKRTCRLLNAQSFKAAIEAHREGAAGGAAGGAAAEAEEEAAEAAAARGGVRGVSAYVRKRPLLPSEAAKGDFDALSVEGGGGGGGRVVAHACLMKPDLVTSPHISPYLPISPS